MLQWFRRRFTIANGAITLALLFAMTGGAFAAKHYLITSTKQISPKVLRQLKGAPGLPGPTGPAGAVGPAGKDGLNGANGTNGKDGESVTSKEVKTSEPTCGKLGGSSFTVSGKTDYACNGSPWTAGGTLPKGASEHGTWAISGHYGQGGPMLAPVSFSVPLVKSLESADVHFIPGQTPEQFAKKEFPTPPAGCKGTFENPEAESGNLCVFQSADGSLVGLGGLISTSVVNSEKLGEEGAGASGAIISGAANFKSPTTEGYVFVFGVWVATG